MCTLALCVWLVVMGDSAAAAADSVAVDRVQVFHVLVCVCMLSCSCIVWRVVGWCGLHLVLSRVCGLH